MVKSQNQYTNQALDWAKNFFKEERKAATQSIVVVVAFSIFLALAIIFLIKIEEFIFAGMGIISLIISLIVLAISIKRYNQHKNFTSSKIAKLIKEESEQIVWVYQKKIGLGDLRVKTIKNPIWHWAYIHKIVVCSVDGKKYPIEVPEDLFNELFMVFASLNKKATIGWDRKFQKKFKHDPSELLEAYKKAGEQAIDYGDHPLILPVIYTVVAILIIFFVSAVAWELIIKPMKYRQRQNQAYYYSDDQNIKIIQNKQDVADENWRMYVKNAQVKSTAEKQNLIVTLKTEPSFQNNDQIRIDEITLVDKDSKLRIDEISSETVVFYEINNDSITAEFSIPADKKTDDYYLRYYSIKNQETWYFELTN